MVGTDSIAARLQLTRLIDSGTLSPEAKRQAIDAITTVNASLFFSSTVNPADALMTTYTIKSGDALSKIARKAGMAADWRMIMRLNGIKDPNRIRAGQVLKVPTCTFHAVVSKSEYRLYLYAGEGSDRVLVATYPVGLGEHNSTPTGAFMLKPGSKLVNPEWRNPRTGEFFKSDDPKNPIGERWIGLQGVDAALHDGVAVDRETGLARERSDLWPQPGRGGRIRRQQCLREIVLKAGEGGAHAHAVPVTPTPPAARAAAHARSRARRAA